MPLRVVPWMAGTLLCAKLRNACLSRRQEPVSRTLIRGLGGRPAGFVRWPGFLGVRGSSPSPAFISLFYILGQDKLGAH